VAEAVRLYPQLSLIIQMIQSFNGSVAGWDHFWQQLFRAAMLLAKNAESSMSSTISEKQVRPKRTRIENIPLVALSPLGTERGRSSDNQSPVAIGSLCFGRKGPCLRNSY
jgi:hypothetical protein